MSSASCHSLLLVLMPDVYFILGLLTVLQILLRSAVFLRAKGARMLVNETGKKVGVFRLSFSEDFNDDDELYSCFLYICLFAATGK